jgi:hypothetical protein
MRVGINAEEADIVNQPRVLGVTREKGANDQCDNSGFSMCENLADRVKIRLAVIRRYLPTAWHGDCNDEHHSRIDRKTRSMT